ncbi:hypothetical protein [Pedobacter sp. GR22-6]|uniref:hypothetical protein n=1 Tax=Pedobacter sp. GR22-6 TaxID=3127957 RepID=UPI00307CF3DA
MKFKYKIKKSLKIDPKVLEEKINTYLLNNHYRIVERAPGYIIFMEDEFSNRRQSRSDFHNRIGEGKFIFTEKTDDGIYLELIYLTSLSYYIVTVMLVTTFGVYTNNIIMPIVISLALTTPILYKIIKVNERVFKEILEC